MKLLQPQLKPGAVRRSARLAAAQVLILIAALFCTLPAPFGSPPPTPTLPNTATVAPTKKPTATKKPTSTKRPTSTKKPTATPAPSATPTIEGAVTTESMLEAAGEITPTAADPAAEGPTVYVILRNRGCFVYYFYIDGVLKTPILRNSEQRFRAPAGPHEVMWCAYEGDLCSAPKKVNWTYAVDFDIPIDPVCIPAPTATKKNKKK